MQFFYIDYMKDGKKERNIGFLRVESDGLSVGLRGVPAQCGASCRVYAVNVYDESILLGEIEIKNGYGMRKFSWKKGTRLEDCVRVEVPLYGNRKGVCILREVDSNLPAKLQWGEKQQEVPIMSQWSKKQQDEKQQRDEKQQEMPAGTQQSERLQFSSAGNTNKAEKQNKSIVNGSRMTSCQDIYEEIHEDKWQQLLSVYPQVHICPEAQSILIRPKDIVILTRQYHGLASNSFVLHAYYNYRQLLLFRYIEFSEENKDKLQAAEGHAKKPKDTLPQYYLGVPGVYYEREQRIAQMFGFEGFENGEARMQPDADRKVYRGCFGYYMKRVEI